jgi:hypothetical protein
MRFLSGSPDIPDDLIRDVTDGNAVFLCGAGVSMRAKFPSFKQLAEQIYIHLGDALCGRGDERAFDPLHRAGIDVELIGNAADAHSSLQSGQYARFQVCGDPWPAKFFALIFGPSQPGADTLPNHRPLELGKDAHHLK